MKNQASGSRTLLLSVIMSSPGPLVVGLGLLSGRSTTQIADFIRRSSELLAILMAFIVYKITTGQDRCADQRKARLERISNAFVGAMMCLGGVFMMLLAFLSPTEDKGNVIPGLAIALLGVIANTLFWRKYARLSREDANPILAVQSRLYRAKALVDGCVTIALFSIVIFPGSRAAVMLDFIGSLIVSAYLIFCGLQTIWEVIQKK